MKKKKSHWKCLIMFKESFPQKSLTLNELSVITIIIEELLKRKMKSNHMLKSVRHVYWALLVSLFFMNIIYAVCNFISSR